MLTAGSRIGSYEIIAPLGAGGMGEVYRARDPRIGREVAIKVLPTDFVRDRDRLARFQQEAQSAGVLNHPNLLTIHELGVDEDRPYIVSELLEGTTLRERLSSGAIPQRKATDYALQLAEGLAAAHERGIVHRDLKPENIFITKDGRVKILDFGLAKLRIKADVRADESTMQQKTDPGTVLGSAGYMSPEQVRGQSVDGRSDIFSLGVILYEMLTGRRAFKGPSSVETMNAILNTDPPDLETLSPPLQRIVGHCLEKNPEERFQSAHDLAFDLESLSDTSTSSRALSTAPRKRIAVPLSIAAAIVLIGIAAAFVAGKRLGRTPAPHFKRMTYRFAFISGARFAPDGQSIVYSCAPTDQGQELYTARLDSPESRSLGITSARLLSISKSGEMAVLLNPGFRPGFRWTGTLARVPLAGGAPREIASDIEDADWNSAGDQLAIIRAVGGDVRLEFPIGTVRYHTSGWLSHPRVSPDGTEVAFLDHPTRGDDAGGVAVIAADGKRTSLTQLFNSVQGLAWAPGGEIWFTGSSSGGTREVYAVTRAGKERRVAGTGIQMILDDISSDGKALITESNNRISLIGTSPGSTQQRDLGWLDWSLIRGLSPDGKLVLFDETSEGGGKGHAVYVRSTDGSPAVHIAEGTAWGLSPDGKWGIALTGPEDSAQGTRSRLMLFPIGPGETRVIPTRLSMERAAWMPDGRHIVVVGHAPDHGARVYLFDLSSGEARAVTPEGFVGVLVSHDGRSVLVSGPDEKRYLWPVAGGAPRELPPMPPDVQLSDFTADDKSLLWFRRFDSPLRVMQFNLQTGESKLWREIPVPQGTLGTPRIQFSADGKTYAFSAYSDAGDVYLMNMQSP